MPKLTKKSIEELSRILNVIPKEELDMYWGMYDNDCFWRCVSYLRGTGITETAAASWAYDWFVYVHGLQEGDYILSTYNDSGIDSAQMLSFLQAHAMLVGKNSCNQIVGVYHTSDLEFYRNNSGMASANHCLILEYENSDGSCQMYDPQNNVSFTVSASEKQHLQKLSGLL